MPASLRVFASVRMRGNALREKSLSGQTHSINHGSHRGWEKNT